MSFEKKSPWLIHYDGSSCNGCDIEVLACLTPLYDVERFGIVNTGDPKHADIFLVTGGVNAQNLPVVRQIYEQMPEPKVVIAVGTCASSGGIFRECYNMLGVGIHSALGTNVAAQTDRDDAIEITATQTATVPTATCTSATKKTTRDNYEQ